MIRIVSKAQKIIVRNVCPKIKIHCPNGVKGVTTPSNMENSNFIRSICVMYDYNCLKSPKNNCTGMYALKSKFTSLMG